MHWESLLPNPAPDTAHEKQSQVRHFLSENIDPPGRKRGLWSGPGVPAYLPKGSLSN